MNIIFGVVIGLLVLMLLVIIHELGHFVMARKNGVIVDEFGIGFPPRLIAWKRIEIIDKDGKKRKRWQRFPRAEWDKVITPLGDSVEAKNHKTATKKEQNTTASQSKKSFILSINLLPIGGFCSMQGETDSDRRAGSFGASSFWSKTQILFGGVLFNWLTAFVILTILALTGMPHFMEHQFYLENDVYITPRPIELQEIIEDTPADKAHLVAGDRITALSTDNSTFVNTVSVTDLVNFNNSHAGETVIYAVVPTGDYTRLTDQGSACWEDDIVNDIVCHVQIQLNPADANTILGVRMSQVSQTLYRSTWSAPLVGAVTTVQLTGETFRGFGEMIWQLVSGVVRQVSPDGATRQSGREDIAKAGDSVSGPVGIIGTIFPAFTSAGPTNLAFLAALIAVSLACMNVLPVPALDGGRWLLIAIYRLRRKPLTKETEAKIVSRAFIVLLALIVLITILDVTRLFK